MKIARQYYEVANFLNTRNRLKVAWRLTRRLRRLVLPTTNSLAYALRDNVKLYEKELMS